MSESQPNLIQIFIKVLEGKTRALDVTQKTTIADIKQKLQDDFGGKIEDIRLVYASKELNYLDKETLANVKITNHSTMCVVTRLKLKKAIYEKNQHQMNLYFAGIKMENSKRIEEYKIIKMTRLFKKKVI